MLVMDVTAVIAALVITPSSITFPLVVYPVPKHVMRASI